MLLRPCDPGGQRHLTRVEGDVCPKDALRSGALKAERPRVLHAAVHVTSPPPWLTKGFRGSIPHPCGSGSKWYITTLTALLVLGAGCVQGSNPIPYEMVQPASITGHELMTEVYPFFKTLRVSRCCSLWPPTWNLESHVGVPGASADLQPFNTEAVFKQVWFCSRDFCHEIPVCIVLACCYNSHLSGGSCVMLWSGKPAVPLDTLSDINLLSNTYLFAIFISSNYFTLPL